MFHNNAYEHSAISVGCHIVTVWVASVIVSQYTKNVGVDEL